ncbi:hypothetical protein RI054_08g45600 [Pseudoscourfieldia marina]
MAARSHRPSLVSRLNDAAAAGQIDSLEQLLQSAPPGVVAARLADDRFMSATPLHAAAEHGQSEAVAYLLANNADACARDDSGATPLHYAAARQASGTQVEQLLAHGADPSVVDDSGAAPMHYAAGAGCADAVVRLIDAGAPAGTSARGLGGATPLHVAAAAGHLAVVEALLSRGGLNIRSALAATDDSARTPLHRACEGGHGSICEFMLSRGANVSAVDVHHRTPYDVAANDSARAAVVQHGGGPREKGVGGQRDSADVSPTPTPPKDPSPPKHEAGPRQSRLRSKFDWVKMERTKGDVREEADLLLAAAQPNHMMAQPSLYREPLPNTSAARPVSAARSPSRSPSSSASVTPRSNGNVASQANERPQTARRHRYGGHAAFLAKYGLHDKAAT